MEIPRIRLPEFASFKAPKRLPLAMANVGLALSLAGCGYRTGPDGKLNGIPTPVPVVTPDASRSLGIIDKIGKNQREVDSIDTAVEWTSDLYSQGTFATMLDHWRGNSIIHFVGAIDQSTQQEARLFIVTNDYDVANKVSRAHIYTDMHEALKPYEAQGTFGTTLDISPDDFYRVGVDAVKQTFKLPESTEWEFTTEDMASGKYPIIRAKGQDSRGSFTLRASKSGIGITILK